MRGFFMSFYMLLFITLQKSKEDNYEKEIYEDGY